MASVRKEIVVGVRPEDVWAAIRDFGAAHRLFAGVLVDARLEGDSRIVTFANGLVVRERLIDLDDGSRRLVYASVGGRATHHNASLQVVAESAARARVIWITDFLPNELAGAIGPLMEQGAAAMKRTLESRQATGPGTS